MSLHSPARFAVRPQLHPALTASRRSRRARATHRPIVEALEERQLLSLLGLAQLDMKSDTASGGFSNLSYKQLGNNANPFQYSATPTALKMPDGSVDRITNQTNKTPARTTLNLNLNNNGYFASAGTSPDFSINGHVVVGSTTDDGTLLTAQAQMFGFSDTITTADAEFEVLLTITGGLLTQAGGPYQVGAPLALLIHQPGLTISSFPATFTVTNSISGTSDTSTIPQTNNRPSQRTPLPGPDRDPLNDLQPGATTAPSQGCGCGGTPPGKPAGSLNSSAAGQDSASGDVALYDGSARDEVTVESVPGRGMDWGLTLTYRSDVQSDGAAGQGWELNDDQRLDVVNSANLATFQSAFPTAKVGDVDLIDGSGRDDLYVLNPDGSYTSPAGQYTRLVLNPDGSYTERLGDGTVINYGVPFTSGPIEPMTSIADPQGDVMRFTYNYEDELISATDTLGRLYQYSYDPLGRVTSVTDYIGRVSRFTYDGNDNLTSITTPAVTGTPTGNNFPNGETTRFTYDASHHLLTVTAPDEVLDGGPPRLTYTYNSSGQVISMTEGGTNTSAVPAGGMITYSYQSIGTPTSSTDATTAVRQTTATDRNGNITVYQYNQFNNTIAVTQEMNRGIDPGIPTSTS
jgi:YD repeat-containing protein